MAHTYKDTLKAKTKADMKWWCVSPLTREVPPSRYPFHWTRLGIPGWFRRVLRRDYRADVQQAMRREQYDTLAAT